MSNTTLTFKSKINGALIDVDGVFLEDAVDDFGVRRVDNLDVVVDSGTEVDRVSLGTYTITFADPEPGISYEYTIKVVYLGTEYFYNRQHLSGSISNLISIPTYDHYTSQTEVLRFMGEYAADLMVDDYASEDKGYIWNQFLQSIDDTIMQYVMQHYDYTTLYQINWIRSRATVLACNLLSQRRGNMPLWVDLTNRYYEELNDIRNNRFRIPGAVVKAWQGPNVRNYLIQSRYFTHPIRVETTKTTGDRYSRQDDAIEPFVYTYA